MILFNIQLHRLQEVFQHSRSGSIGGSSWRCAFYFCESKLKVRLTEHILDSLVYRLLLSEPNGKEKDDGAVLTWHQNVGQFEILDPEPPLN